MKRFGKKCVIVTGASSGVGRAIALAFGAKEATVAIVGRDKSRLAEVAVQIDRNGGNASVFTAEFCDPASVDLLGSALAQRFSTVDALIHSAGMIKLAPFASASLDDLDSHYRCNLRAPVALTQAMLPQLIAAKGCVVFINSTAVDNAHAGVGHYAASKHGLKAIADNLREEVNAQGVRVLSVFLGRTATPMQASIACAENAHYEPTRLIQPGDVAELVVNALSSGPSVEMTNVCLRPVLPPK